MPAKRPETPQRANMEPTEVRVKAKMDPVAKLLGTSRTVAYRPEFAHITGSPTAGLLLSQFWYWSECPTTEKRDGWFYMTMDQISEQTGMIREEQETARKRLKAIGVLHEERKSTGRGKPACMWFRIDEERLYELLRRYVEVVNAGIPHSDNPTIANAGIPQSKVRELRNMARGNPAIVNEGIPQYIILESSSGESSIDVSGDGETPPINPPEGEETGRNAEEETNRAIGQRGDRESEEIPTREGRPEDTATPDAVWSSVLSRLEKPIRLPLKLIDLTDTTATLATTGQWARGWLEDHKCEVLTAAFTAVLGRPVVVNFSTTQI